jgi:hypothetical protein
MIRVTQDFIQLPSHTPKIEQCKTPAEPVKKKSSM